MKKIIAGAAFLLMFASVALYMHFAGKEYVVRITEADIQEKLEAKLPITRRYLLIIELTLMNPRAHLENGTDRISAGLDALLNIRINGNPKPLGGTIDVSGGLAYVSEAGEFFLVDPVVESLQIQGIPSAYLSKVNDAATKLLGSYFEKNPVYTLTTANLKQATARAVLKTVEIHDEELVVTLGI